MSGRSRPEKGRKLVFCRSYLHPKTKRRVYAKAGKVFVFEVAA